MASRRKEMVALLVDKLKEIDGQAVGGTNYTYNLTSRRLTVNLFLRVFKKFLQILV